MSAVDPDLDFIRVDEEAFLACPEESVDYAVMERTADAVVVPMDAGWSDVGSRSSLWEISAHTAEGNVCHGDVINHKTENSYVYAESGTVTTVGVKDLVVVQTKDAVLIADRNAVQDVKKWSSRSKPMVAMSIGCIAKCIVRGANMTLSTRATATSETHHRETGRGLVGTDAPSPRGTLGSGRGTAKVTIDGDIKLLGENESIYIPLGRRTARKTRGKFRSI